MRYVGRQPAGLIREMWNLMGKAMWCCESCPERRGSLSAQRAGRLAREHTRETGHPTRTAHVKVTEYRKAA